MRFQSVREKFDFIVLDCPPALDLLTLNALVAADSVLVPMQAEYFALEGVSELLDTIDRLRQSFNPGLQIEGVVLTMYDDRTNLAQQVNAGIKASLWRQTAGKPSSLATSGWLRRPSYGKPALLYGCAVSRGPKATFVWPRRSCRGGCSPRLLNPQAHFQTEPSVAPDDQRQDFSDGKALKRVNES